MFYTHLIQLSMESFIHSLEKYIAILYMRKMAKKRTRKLTDWNLFVMKIKKENPTLSFKQVLKKASKDRKTRKAK